MFIRYSQSHLRLLRKMTYGGLFEERKWIYKCLNTKNPQKYLNFKKDEENILFRILHDSKSDLCSPCSAVRSLNCETAMG